MGLAPFEIMLGVPPFIISSQQTDILLELNDWDVLDAIQQVQWAHKHVWLKLRALYESGVHPEPQRFWPGD